MAETKILDLIPESLKEDLIKEIESILKDRSKKTEKIPPTKEELEAILNNIM